VNGSALEIPFLEGQPALSFLIWRVIPVGTLGLIVREVDVIDQARRSLTDGCDP